MKQIKRPRHQPEKEGGLLGIDLLVQVGNEVRMAQHHLTCDLRISRLVRVPEVASPQAREKKRAGKKETSYQGQRDPSIVG